jgi:hypothetical protein
MLASEVVELPLVERKEDEVRAGSCCEPDCGPETCAPASSSHGEVEEREEQARAQAGCCEPDCGPETYSC